MYVKRHYSLWMTVRWSRKSLIYGFIYSAIIVLAYEFTGIPFSLPWQPISVIGIAVAFFLGFKNNSSYDRAWEARKIWGAVINESRTFATAILSIPDPWVKEEWKQSMIYRHLAWVLALKHAMRKGKSWEHNGPTEKLVFTPHFQKECQDGVVPEIQRYLNPVELDILLRYTNLPTQLLKNQSLELEKIHLEDKLSDYKQVYLHGLIGKLYDLQGKSERIKNFPFPRQYASTGLWITYIFCMLIPFGLLDIFGKTSDLHYWLTVPFSAIIIWVFLLVDRIGDYSENPFEAAYNDVPISSISRGIEIDLLEMLDEKDIPPPYPVENGFLL
ncbi:bestrophin family protein [Algoriphagus hitonicola]|uniref:Putative membrane protein n=1 Tax=Algoriphagus hitonicola TaxID=435880 RepID=A0A1I2TZT8_9BACT|nr:bestrophin family ion channel [Algoriphagus hitonicola]SFG68176.1 putative membrane protein [Algoriphagus hitonicola]